MGFYKQIHTSPPNIPFVTPRQKSSSCKFLSCCATICYYSLPWPSEKALARETVCLISAPSSFSALVCSLRNIGSTHLLSQMLSRNYAKYPPIPDSLSVTINSCLKVQVFVTNFVPSVNCIWIYIIYTRTSNSHL